MDDVNRLEQAIRSATECMNRVENVDTAIFVGKTRSGKSTLINYLIGNKLVGVKGDSYRPVSINKADDSPGPKIGLGCTSETIIPTEWSSTKLPGLTIWDVPGFDDNRGVIQDIVNSFYLNGLFKHVASAKIVVVVDINDLTNDNVGPLLKVFKAVENLLREKIRDCLASVSMIITKVPDVLFDTKADKEFICDILQNQLLTSSEIDISDAIRHLVQHLVINKENIGLFKIPEVGEVKDTAVDDGIVNAIDSAHSIPKNILMQICPSIAESSKLYLIQKRERLSFTQALISLQNTINTVINDSMAHFEGMQHDGTSHDQLINLNHELTVLKDKLLHCLNSPMTYESKMDACKVIDPAVDSFIRQRNIIEMSKLILFIDYVLNRNEAQNAVNFIQNSLNSGLEMLDRLLSWIPSQFEAIKRKQAEEQAARERTKQEEQMRQLEARIEEERRVQAQLEERRRAQEEENKRIENQRWLENQRNLDRIAEQHRQRAEAERHRRDEYRRQMELDNRRRREEASRRTADMNKRLQKR